ncbi:hypothetical protein QVD17_29114 [Tagetes erecta]|uniref:CASP-like protein n=1 Tax=Tagetes erecta TaxID=13708 RepID=A0AAD8KDV5_TARER|nr:hypothetical protein QVD17_29114 [Tagetes erecta]
MSDLKYDEPKASKMPIVTLASRVTILATLAVSMSLLKSNGVTYKQGPDDPVPFNYNDVVTYEYVFFGMVAGFGYNLLQVPFAMYFFFTKKRLINNNTFFEFEFYGDKICLTLLATVVGSLFGATVETRNRSLDIEDIDGYPAANYHLKVKEFCMMAYVSAGFLLIGFISSMVLSIVSSKALAIK